MLMEHVAGGEAKGEGMYRGGGLGVFRFFLKRRRGGGSGRGGSILLGGEARWVQGREFKGMSILL